MPFYEDFQEFARRMDCPHVTSRGRHLFENGGQSNGVHHLDAPVEEIPRLRLQAEYLTVLLKREEAAFTQYRGECLEAASLAKRYANLPGAPRDAPQQLRAGQDRIGALRDRLAEIAAKLRPDEGARQAVDAMLAEQRAHQSDLINEISNITLYQP